jgi:hypothetical protein
MLTTFNKTVTQELAGQGLEVKQWQGATRRSAHLLEINTKPRSTVLYIKESSSSPGFWGLTRNQILCLDRAAIKWFVVLLARSAGSGYLLTGGEVQRNIKDGTFELSKDGDYKVNERSDLYPTMAFRSTKDFLTRIL